MNEWILYLYTIVRSAKLVGSCINKVLQFLRDYSFLFVYENVPLWMRWTRKHKNSLVQARTPCLEAAEKNKQDLTVIQKTNERRLQLCRHREKRRRAGETSRFIIRDDVSNRLDTPEKSELRRQARKTKTKSRAKGKIESHENQQLRLQRRREERRARLERETPVHM